MVENGHSLSSSSYTAPHHLVKSIFCLRLRGFCSYHHLDRQVSSAGEAMEHGLSGTLQSRAMRRKGVTTHTNRKHCLYPYAAQKPLIVAHRTITYSITDLHSNLQYRKDWGEKKLPCCLLAYHLFPFSWISGSASHMTHLCSVMSCSPLKRRRHEMFGCSSSHHLTCLLASPPVHPLRTWSMHTRPYKHTATTRSFEELSLFHPMLNHVQ